MSINKLLKMFSVLLVFILIITPAHSKQIQVFKIRWHFIPPPKIEYYYINSNGVENIQELIDATINAFQTWEKVTKDIVKFEYRGLVNYPAGKMISSSLDDNDGKNTISFLSQLWPTIWKEQKNKPLVAVTRLKFNVDMKSEQAFIHEFDIYLNSNFYHFEVFKSNSKNKFISSGIFSALIQKSSKSLDLESVLVHQIGRALGLPDLKKNRYKECTMYYQTFFGETKKRSLTNIDIILFQEIYADYFEKDKYKEKNSK